MLHFANVVATHPSRRTVDLVDMDSGARYVDVKVVSSTVGASGGSWDVPDVTPPSNDAQAGQMGSLVAVYALTGRKRPMVVGFAQPAGGLLVFTQQNRSISRHPSGAYTTTAPDGSYEVWHPSGAFFRIGAGGHEDLSGVAAGTWSDGSGSPAQITLGTQGFTLTVQPGGNTSIVSQGTITFQAAALAFNTTGNSNFSSSGQIVMNAASIRLND